MPKCQFCQQPGEYMPAEVMGPPHTPTVGGRGLKLVTCDFHLHHCAFFVCAECWAAERHLCKGEHPSWEARIDNWAPNNGGKSLRIRARWRYRYTSERDGKSYPAICTLTGVGILYCSVCNRPARTTDITFQCLYDGCAGRMIGAGCPACVEISLPAHNGIQIPCPYATTAMTDDPDMVVPQPMTIAPDELASFRRLPIRYRDEKYYEVETANLLDEGASRVLVCLDCPVYESNAEEQIEEQTENDDNAGNDVVDHNQMSLYVATNMKLVRNGWPLANLTVLLPEEGFEKLSDYTQPSLKRGERRCVKDSTARFGGAMLFRANGCRVFRLLPEQLTELEVPYDQIRSEPLMIKMPSRGGGSGGALGRANDVGSSGISHLVTHPPSCPEMNSSAYAKFLEVAKTVDNRGDISEFIAPLGVAGKSVLQVRTLNDSKLDLFMGMSKPEAANQDKLALELLREWQDRWETAWQVRAQINADLVWAEIFSDDKWSMMREKIDNFDADSRRIWDSNTYPSIQMALSEDTLKQARINPILARIQECIRQADVYEARLASRPEELCLEDIDIGRRIRARLNDKGHPDECVDAQVWWDELWVNIPDHNRPGYDTVVSAADRHDTSNTKEVSSDDPSAWPSYPPISSVFWDWNGRPLEIHISVENTWNRLTRKKLESREYKDSHLFIMRPHTQKRGDDERDQDTFFDGISATEVATGVTNRVAAHTERLGKHAPDYKARRPAAAFEWSHLVGDGEGGGIHRSNLVASSRANNTEMLVIESLLQEVWKTTNKADLDIVIRVEATLGERVASLEQNQTFFDSIRLTPYQSHVGDWMRYRVWFRRRGKPASGFCVAQNIHDNGCLVIDHILDCNRRFISKAAVRLFAFQIRSRVVSMLQDNFKVTHGSSTRGGKSAKKPENNGKMQIE